MMWIQIFHSLHSSNEQEMIKKATAGVPDHNDRARLSGNAEVATCGGRLLVSDHRHVGLKLHEDGRARLPRCGCIHSAGGRAQIGESNSPGVTQDYIHAGKIDGGGEEEGRNDEAFHCHQSISVHPGWLWCHTVRRQCV